MFRRALVRRVVARAMGNELLLGKLSPAHPLSAPTVLGGFQAAKPRPLGKAGGSLHQEGGGLSIGKAGAPHQEGGGLPLPARRQSFVEPRLPGEEQWHASQLGVWR